MRFIDEVKVEVRAGNGGSGCVSFRREKYIPKGGPNGGDGGRGGNVIAVATAHKRTLIDLYYRKRLIAANGGGGMGSDRHGKDGENVIVELPIGTVIKDEEGGLIADLDHEGARFCLAKSGRGGLGNAHFTTSTNQAPRYAQPGEEGEGFWRILELKTMADVGLVGLPNAGKSTLLARISAARPKIADYPFTTLVPQLGVVRLDMDDGFVVADIPGLIQGAHEGRGLGDRFLRHIERTRLLLHMIDIAAQDGKGVLEQLHEIEAELASYEVDLTQRPRFVVLNKIDALTEDVLARQLEEASQQGLPVFAVSAVSGAGISKLLRAVGDFLADMEDEA
jgi:GTP-binding protein